MKHLKHYENQTQTEPRKGDYILPNIKHNVENTWYDFFNNTIGKINYVLKKDKNPYDIVIFYKAEDVPEEFKYIQLQPADKYNKNFYLIKIMTKNDFYYSKNKKDLAILIAQNKYNL